MKLFRTGKTVMTSGVANRAEEDNAFFGFVLDSLVRHVSGDWGDLCDEDKELNDRAITGGHRLFSAYKHDEDKIYIITEADRSATTVLFPDEY